MPAPFQPVPFTAQLIAQYAAPVGDVAENVHYVKTTGAWTAGNLSALCDAYANWLTTSVGGSAPAAQLNSHYALNQLVATDLGVEDGLQVQKTPTGGPIAGTTGGASVNAGLTLAVKWVTGVRGRAHLGRSYVIGIDGGSVTSDQNYVTPGYGAKLITNYNALKNVFPATNGAWSLVIVSRKKKGIAEVPGYPDQRATALTTPVTGVALSDFAIDFERRRAPAHSRRL